MGEARTISFDATDVADGNLDARAFGDPVAQLPKIIECRGCKQDRSKLQRRTLRRGVYRARSSAKTFFAGSLRSG